MLMFLGNNSILSYGFAWTMGNPVQNRFAGQRLGSYADWDTLLCLPADVYKLQKTWSKR